MALSNDLISQFVKITNDSNKKSKKESSVYGTIVDYDGAKYIRFDGSDLLTPMTSTAGVNDGDRVTATIKNHEVTVTGNISSPSATDKSVKDLDSKVGDFVTVITTELNANTANIEDLKADNVFIKNKLTANDAYISELQADNVTINNKLTANEADIKKIQTEKLDANLASITYATIENLDVTNESVRNLAVDYGNFKQTTTDSLTANTASIKKLNADKANVTDLNAANASIDDLKANKANVTDLNAAKAQIDDLVAKQITADYLKANYADIDLANVSNAWIQNGVIKNGAITEAAIHDGAITNVKIADASIEAAKIKSINADTITTGTLKTNRLIITDNDGNDSIVKAINIANGVAEAEVNSKQLQAASIDVVDLTAFKAKIAQFDMKDNAIYSGKTSITDPTSGIYISTNGIGAGNGALVGSTESPVQIYADGGMKLKGKNGCIDFDAVAGELDINATSLKIGSKTVASNEDVTNAVNGVEVGGRNLILNSDVWTSSGVTSTGVTASIEDGALKVVTTSGNGYWHHFQCDNVIEENLNEGDAFTFSIEIKSEDGTNPPAIYFKPGMGYYKFTGSVSSDYSWVHYTGVWKKTNPIQMHFGWSDTVGTYYIRKIKFEKGNKATDWTPAPEDIGSDVNALTTRVATAETSIDQNSAAILLRATKTELTTAIDGVNSTLNEHSTKIEENATAINLRATKTEVSTAKSEAISGAATDATNKANAAKTDAISAAATDATTKADKAKSDAIDAAATDATTKANQVLADSKTYTDAQIKVSADNITSTVRKTYQTKSDMSNYITSTAANTTFATSKSLEALSGNLNSYIESSTSMIQDINGWQYTWNRILRTDEADIANHQDYITFQNGDIILGESSNDLKVKISNDAIQFKGDSDTDITPDSDATAWITGQQFNIDRGEIHTSLKIGNLQFTPRTNGNFSITIAT